MYKNTILRLIRMVSIYQQTKLGAHIFTGDRDIGEKPNPTWCPPSSWILSKSVIMCPRDGRMANICLRTKSDANISTGDRSKIQHGGRRHV